MVLAGKDVNATWKMRHGIWDKSWLKLKEIACDTVGMEHTGRAGR